LATTYVTLKCRLKWAQVYDPDSFAGAERWKVNIFPVDDKEWEKFKRAGLSLEIKDDKDGDGKFITVRRPTKKVIGDNLVVFCPPQITGQVKVAYRDSEGAILRQYTKGEYTGGVHEEGEKELIGNGSVAFVNICVYDTAKGKGHRLEGLNILELVEYVEDPSEEKEETPKKEEPKKNAIEKVFNKKEKVEDKVDLKDDLNDDIPW